MDGSARAARTDGVALSAGKRIGNDLSPARLDIKGDRGPGSGTRSVEKMGGGRRRSAGRVLAIDGIGRGGKRLANRRAKRGALSRGEPAGRAALPLSRAGECGR